MGRTFFFFVIARRYRRQLNVIRQDKQYTQAAVYDVAYVRNEGKWRPLSRSWKLPRMASWEKKKKKKRISSVRGDRCRRIKSIVDDDKERKKQK